MIVRFIPIIAMLLFSCGDSGSDGKFNPPEGYKSRSGKKIYTQHCTSCHGPDGKLGSAGAKDLTKSKLDSARIVNILKNGKNGMPRQIQYFKSDEEVDNIVDYVKSMRK